MLKHVFVVDKGVLVDEEVVRWRDYWVLIIIGLIGHQWRCLGFGITGSGRG